MKVVLINHSFPPVIGGGQTYLYNLANRLPDLGVEVDVITGELPEAYSENDVPYIKGTIYRINGLKDYSKSQGDSRAVIESVYKALIQSKPNVIYAHGYASCILASIFKAVFPNIKVIFTYHSTPIPSDSKFAGVFSDPELDLGYARYVFSQGAYDVLLAQSRYCQDFALKNGAALDKVVLNYLGVDLDIFKRDVSKNTFFTRKEGATYLCLPVRLIKRKGIEETLKALADLPSRYQLIIVTSTDYTSDQYERFVDDQINSLGLTDRVTVLKNMVNFSQMPIIYSNCDITIMPACIEGLGLGTIESMACGAPVVGANTSGTAEIIEDGVNGLLFDPGDHMSLTKAILKLEDMNLCQILTANALNLVKDRFDSNKQINNIATLLKERFCT